MRKPRDLPERLRAIHRAIARRYPYLSADEARRAAGRSRDTTLGFGITPGRIVVQLLQAADVQPHDVFWDIGSGPGSCVLAAAQLVREAHGAELLRPLARLGEQAARELGVGNVRWHHGDFRRMNVRSGTIFYCYSTCFTAALMEALGDKLATTAEGTRVFTVTRELDHPDFELVWTKSFRWGAKDQGTRHVHFHLRRPRRRARRGAGG